MYQEQIKKLQGLIFNIQDDNLNIGTATIEDLKRKELKLKEQFIKENHKNKISEVTFTDRGVERTKWQTRIADGKKITAITYESLIEKLYDYYEPYNQLSDYSFKTVFDIAVPEYARRNAVKDETVKRYRQTYNTYFAEIADKDIRKLTRDDIDDFLLSVAEEMRKNNRGEKFTNIKTDLNIVFNYAVSKGIINFSPVPIGNRTYTKTIGKIKPKPEDKAFQPDEIELIRQECFNRINKSKYDYNAYAIVFSSYSGVRESEIPSLKWDDISFVNDEIHIHTMQVYEDNKPIMVNYTKNEKGVSRGGRKFPLYNELRKLLFDLKSTQNNLGIKSEYVFCDIQGKPINTISYSDALRRLCKKLGLKLTNNHAFRIALNSYVLCELGLPSTERGKLLGHTAKVNEEHYTFARADESLKYITDLLNGVHKDVNPVEPKIIDFVAKRKTS